MEIVQRFEANQQGRDFAVGDIHGCFHVLEKALIDVAFDVAKDRLFSCGDLVNRGPLSHRVYWFIQQPWFKAVKGNHEDIAVEAFSGHDLYGLKAGDWLSRLKQNELQTLYSYLNRMPLAFDIKTRSNKRIGIIHADIMHPDWDMFLQDLKRDGPNSLLARRTMWDRTRYRHSENVEFLPVAGVYRIYVGHSVVERPSYHENIFYIDTGCVYGNGLTMVNLDTDEMTFTPYWDYSDPNHPNNRIENQG